jgi:Right handed beta helix region
MWKTENSHLLFLALALILGVLLNQIGLADAQAATIYENTTRTGNTAADEIWRGTIDVTGDITVASGSTLTIEPGTIVRFAAGSDDQNKGPAEPITDPNFPHDPAIAPSTICSINIYGGSLYAIGTSDTPVVFTSSAANPKPGDWQSIQYILPGSVLRLQYAVIEYGYYGVQINTIATDTNITINNNIMLDIVACAVCCGYNQVSITVSHNDISGCGHEGVDTHQGANLVIENNVFHDIYNHVDGPTGAGVIIDGNSSTVRNNRFERNRFGMNILSPSSPHISGNAFADNYANCWGYCPSPLQRAWTAPLPLLLSD